jgi:hypothetical protein
MSFGDIFKHLSPLYDAATGFTGTAAPMAMMALGAKMPGATGMGGGMGGMGGGASPQMMSSPSSFGGSFNIPQNNQETEAERKLRLLTKALRESGL